jgi:hypothetical protein
MLQAFHRLALILLLPKAPIQRDRTDAMSTSELDDPDMGARTKRRDV